MRTVSTKATLRNERLMIPSEIADLADLIMPGWIDADPLTGAEVIKAAMRIWEAGYRLSSQDPN